MGPEFWHERWRKGQIGFHRSLPHPLLVEHAGRFTEGSSVLVPLAGKSHDLRYLASQGHRVVGVEIVEDAVKAFFEEAGLQPTVQTRGHHPVYRAASVELHVKDFFRMTPGEIGDVKGVYDRASLIALPPDLRGPYAALLAALVPAGAHILMITIDYEAEGFAGPPFSVPPSQVEALFGGPFNVTSLGTRDGLADAPDLRQGGLIRMTEHAMWLRRRL